MRDTVVPTKLSHVLPYTRENVEHLHRTFIQMQTDLHKQGWALSMLFLEKTDARPQHWYCQFTRLDADTGQTAPHVNGRFESHMDAMERIYAAMADVKRASGETN